MLEERLLRFAAPALYAKMTEVFSASHLHPYDVQATVCKIENGIDVILRFCPDFSQSCEKSFTLEQAACQDEEAARFFEEAAAKCKALLIADYYKMMKP